MSQASLGHTDTGHIVNLVTNDVQKTEEVRNIKFHQIPQVSLNRRGSRIFRTLVKIKISEGRGLRGVAVSLHIRAHDLKLCLHYTRF